MLALRGSVSQVLELFEREGVHSGYCQVQHAQRLTYLTSPFLLLYLLLYLQRDGPNRVDIWTDLKWGPRILA
jgi:hypothetical protein